MLPPSPDFVQCPLCATNLMYVNWDVCAQCWQETRQLTPGEYYRDGTEPFELSVEDIERLALRTEARVERLRAEREQFALKNVHRDLERRVGFIKGQGAEAFDSVIKAVAATRKGESLTHDHCVALLRPLWAMYAAAGGDEDWFQDAGDFDPKTIEDRAESFSNSVVDIFWSQNL